MCGVGKERHNYNSHFSAHCDSVITLQSATLFYLLFEGVWCVNISTFQAFHTPLPEQTMPTREQKSATFTKYSNSFLFSQHLAALWFKAMCDQAKERHVQWPFILRLELRALVWYTKQETPLIWQLASACEWKQYFSRQWPNRTWKQHWNLEFCLRIDQVDFF